MNAILTILENVFNNNCFSLLYIDPATTSYIIQIGAGVIIAIGTVIGIYSSKIKRLFKKNKEESTSPIEKERDVKKEVITAEDLLKDEESSE